MTPQAIEHAVSRLDNDCRALFEAIIGRRPATDDEKFMALAAINDDSLQEGDPRLIENRALHRAVSTAVLLAAEANPHEAQKNLKNWAMDIAMLPKE